MSIVMTDPYPIHERIMKRTSLPFLAAVALMCATGCRTATVSQPQDSKFQSVSSLQPSKYTLKPWRIPALEEVAAIWVLTPSHWFLIITPDGSGSLTGGSANNYGAFISPKTFTFSELYDSLSLSVRKDGDSKKMIEVIFITEGKQPANVNSLTDDIAFIRQLFDNARKHCTPRDKEFFERVWTERPPVP